MPPRAALAAALAALGAFASPLAAQGACDGQPIRAIRIDARNIFGRDDSLIPGFVRGVGNALHVQTREDVVRLDLLFREGDACDPRRLQESERLLRARPYIRSAAVIAVPTGDGGVAVLVQTRDELSLEGRLAVSTAGGYLMRHVAFGEENVLGRGASFYGDFNDEGRRAAIDADALDPHFLGRRLDLELEGGRSEVGPVAQETIRRAFESDFDRVAWRESLRYRKEPFTLVSTALGGAVAEPLVTMGADAGVAVRFGRPGELRVVGLALSAEQITEDGAPLGPAPALDTTARRLLAGRFEEQRRLRAHLFLGARRIRFAPFRGLDAVHALEDVPLGTQAGLVLGKSLFGGAGLQHDWFAAMELSTGAQAGGRLLVFTRAKVEGRYLTATGGWDGVLADGQVLAYELGRRTTTVLSAEAAGGWDTRTPFQLLLAGADGVRGYGMAAIPVGRRIVLRAERRYFLGNVLGFADAGAAVFAEGARGWAGDAAFGENSGMVGTVGAGLRLAAPRGSRRTYRFDVAMPVTRGLGPQFTLAIGQQFGIFHGEPQDVVRSRETISSVTVFDFPRF